MRIAEYLVLWSFKNNRVVGENDLANKPFRAPRKKKVGFGLQVYHFSIDTYSILNTKGKVLFEGDLGEEALSLYLKAYEN